MRTIVWLTLSVYAEGYYDSLWINMSMWKHRGVDGGLCVSTGVYGGLCESMDKYEYTSVYGCL